LAAWSLCAFVKTTWRAGDIRHPNVEVCNDPVGGVL
jgi:hypothetical protein